MFVRLDSVRGLLSMRSRAGRAARSEHRARAHQAAQARQLDRRGLPRRPAEGGPVRRGRTPSNMVTTFTAGETIEVEWEETIPHPGLFRIALVENRAELKDPSIVRDKIDCFCNYPPGAVPSTAVAPVLADNLFPTTDLADSRGTMKTEGHAAEQALREVHAAGHPVHARATRSRASTTTAPTSRSSRVTARRRRGGGRAAERPVVRAAARAALARARCRRYGRHCRQRRAAAARRHAIRPAMRRDDRRGRCAPA